MLLRHIDIPHELQKSMDQLYIKVKQMAQLPEQEFEIDFEPGPGQCDCPSSLGNQ